MPTPVACQQCSPPFIPQHHSQQTAVFCSVACRGVSRRNSLMVICEQCQQPFKVRAYRKDTAKFCSKACKHLSMAIPDIQAACLQCNKPFVVSVNKKGKQAGQFCSQACRSAHIGQGKRGIALRDFWARVQMCVHGYDCCFCCWPWSGALDLNGYGKIIVDGRQTYTHRAAWELHHQKALSPDVKIGHYCHQTSCANFDHTHAGTQKDNLDDSIRDKRHAFGERNGHARLTEETATEALTLYASGCWPFRDIAARFGVTHGAIEALWHGESWKYLPRPPSAPAIKQ